MHLHELKANELLIDHQALNDLSSCIVIGAEVTISYQDD